MADGWKHYNKSITKILTRIKRGDVGKTDELFSKTYNHFYGYAFIKIWDKSKAEDALMAMYENVLKYINSFDPAGSGTGWMFSILKKIIYNFNAEDEERRKYELPITDDIQDSELNSMYDSLGVSEAVGEMDAINRRILYLYFFERKTLCEVGAELNLSKSAVHKRKKQIENFLKNFLT